MTTRQAVLLVFLAGALGTCRSGCYGDPLGHRLYLNPMTGCCERISGDEATGPECCTCSNSPTLGCGPESHLANRYGSSALDIEHLKQTCESAVGGTGVIVVDLACETSTSP